LITYILYI